MVSAKANVRVRFAPSPTGFLHVGGARTALFNWLFARHHKGTFILRIEDTDEVRSTHDSVDAILDSMVWMGLDWDEGPVYESRSGDAWRSTGDFGPYFQMQRIEHYQKYLHQLEKEGKAYRCYCTPEEVEAMRRQAQLEKRPPKYDGRCRNLTEAERKDRESRGTKYVLRFKMPLEGETLVHDLIRGEVRFENALQQDLVIQKTSGVPTYNFACVIDDHLMEISHVIRGEEHLSNTPSQVQMYWAFGWQPPLFAHLSMILGPDGTKLSKRHGATSVLEYKNQGYLPASLRNYLSLLGWGTETSQDIFEPEELIAKFTVERCQKNPATFDFNKLLWMNGMYIRKLSKEALFEASRPFLSAGLIDEAKLKELVALEQEKYKTFLDVPKLLDFFFTDEYVYRWPDLEGLMAKSPNLKTPAECRRLAGELTIRLGRSSDFSAAAIEAVLRQIAAEWKWKNPEVFHPLRFAVSGRLQGPSLFHMVEALGKERALKRLERFLGSLKEFKAEVR
ncbi:MAG: glutamate--tRNA ligase [Elusimicrobia bacterium]|nr:glutamate--tRNA ligase [Elusimicrobiota bacterium]